MMTDNQSMADAIKAKFKDSVFLNTEEFAQINQAVIETPAQDNVMINAFPQYVNSNMWALNHVYEKLDKYGSATESSVPGDAEAVTVNGTKVTVELPFYHADFSISMFDLNNSKALGGRLDTIKAEAAARKVNDLFDTAIYERSSLFGSLGAFNLFTGTAAASAKWTGTSPDIIFNDIVSFINAIPAAYMSNDMRMVLHQTDFGSLARTNSYGLSALDLLKKTYPGVQILVTGRATAGKGLLYPFRKDVAYVVQGFPLTTLEWEPKPFESRYKVVRSGRLVVVAATAGIRLNGLS